MSQSVLDILEQEEGFRSHVYQDHLGFWTIGYGTLVDERKGGGITQAEGRYLMANRLVTIRKGLDAEIPWWRSQPADVMDALVCMAYQMGVKGVCGFKNMLGHLEVGARHEAATEALDSKWARDDTPARAELVAAMIKGE